LLDLVPQLLSAKKTLYLVNMTSRDYLRKGIAQTPAVQSVQEAVDLLIGDRPSSSGGGGGGGGTGAGAGSEVITLSLEFEENLFRIETQEGPDALAEYFLANPTHASAMPFILAEAHRSLGLIHFYTTTERDVKCWCLKQGKTIMESSAIVDVKISR
jgi:hypothetical protein